MILAGGTFEDQRLLSRETIKRMFANQIEHLDASTGLGWELNQPHYMGAEAPHIAGKTGFTGCVIMCHTKRSLGLVLLSNTTYPHRHQNRERINEVRRDVADLVFAGNE
jgi:CubicO group peptidase (beta-lactamase class C family)